MFRLSPERAHSTTEWFLKRRRIWRLASAYLDHQVPCLSVSVAGLEFPSPVGLAAGYDKDCEFLGALMDLGFGYVVGGTVVPQARPGNPQPRLMRLPDQQSLINALGFPSKGMAAAIKRLERVRREIRWYPKPVVVSVAGLSLEEFQTCQEALEPFADATELNISSPNTQGIRVFQEPAMFKALLERINAGRTKPVFIKVPPYSDDQGREDVLTLVRIAREQGVDGITAANTRPVEAPQLAMGRGGLSGHAILEDTVRIVAEVRAEAGPTMAVHACGGIFTTEDALRALRAGANTVQLLTGLIYQGPAIARNINRGLERLIRERGYASLEELVSSGT